MGGVEVAGGWFGSEGDPAHRGRNVWGVQYRYNRLFIFYGTFHTSGFRIIAPRAPALNLLTARPGAGGLERKLRSKNIETVGWGGMNRKVGSMVCRTS